MTRPMNHNFTSIDPEFLSPLTLAYIGDAVYELWVRRYLVSKGPHRVNELHREAIKYVNAATQSKLVALLEPVLNEKELAVLRKGRNAKSGRQPKNMDMIDYRRATGLEALVGYLYLLNQPARLEEIFLQLTQLVEKEND